MTRTANPALSASTFKNLPAVVTADSAMTIGGTVNKSFLLLAILIVTSAFTWTIAVGAADPSAVTGWMIFGLIGGLVAALVTVFKKTWAPFTAPIYAALEGLAIGGISAFAEARFPGIVLQAVALTFGTMLALLAAYRSGLIKVTQNFLLGVTAATGAIFLVYLANFIMRFFGTNIPFIHDNGWLGIGFSLVVVVVAALNLVLDFDFIEKGAEQGAPKYMEWYAAFGLMVTLVWLYLEILRLLTKLRSRD
jgi:uncharacterized YccA/Bax inhibitor family protein